ncbi:MAG: hypothetical protein ACM3Q2_02130 [Syntrophothermus sp.]
MMRFTVSIVFLALLILSAGCGTVEDKVFLQRAEVNGPIYQPPIVMTGAKPDSTVTLSAKFFAGSKSRIHAQMGSTSDISPKDFFQNGNIPFQDWNWDEGARNNSLHNLRWNMPDFYAGVDADVPLSKSISFLLGFSYSNAGSKNLYGGSIGLSAFSFKDGIGARFGFGASLQQYSYDAYSLLVRRTIPNNDVESQTTYLLHDVDVNSNINFYLNLTINSEYKTFPLNYFFSLGYFNQKILDFEPSTPYYTSDVSTPELFMHHITTDARGEASNSYLSLTPGIYIKLSDIHRVVLGTGILRTISGLQNSTSQWMLVPMMKFDFML